MSVLVIFNLINLGFLQAASMQALWIRLNCSLEEINGKTSKESLESAVKKLHFTYYFTAILIIASEACVVYLVISGSKHLKEN